MKICAPGAHVLKVRSAPSLDLQQHSAHILNSLEMQLDRLSNSTLRH